MGKMFGNLSTEGMETPEDRLGGGFEAFPSDVYDGTITLAYAGQSQGGAQSVTIHVDIDGKELRETIYVTNKKGENFFVDKKTEKKTPLPGYTTIDDICLFCTEEGLPDQDTEEKTVKIYDFDERKELPKPVQCLTGIMGKPIKLGVLREIDDKRKKGDDGQYHPTGETITRNTIDKVFHPETGRTVNEYRHEITDPEFLEAWTQKNKGEDRNKASGTGNSGAGATGSGKPSGFGGSGAPKKKLFGN